MNPTIAILTLEMDCLVHWSDFNDDDESWMKIYSFCDLESTWKIGKLWEATEETILGHNFNDVSVYCESTEDARKREKTLRVYKGSSLFESKKRFPLTVITFSSLLATSERTSVKIHHSHTHARLSQRFHSLSNKNSSIQTLCSL